VKRDFERSRKAPRGRDHRKAKRLLASLVIAVARDPSGRARQTVRGHRAHLPPVAYRMLEAAQAEAWSSACATRLRDGPLADEVTSALHARIAARQRDPESSDASSRR